MGRFNYLQDQLKRESSRANRLSFLSNLLLDNNKKSEAIKDGLEEVNIEFDVSNTNPTGNANLVTLSHEEMKERGLLVVSLPKDQEKEKPAPIADSDNPASTNGQSANPSSNSSGNNNNSNNSSGSSASQPNKPPRTGSYRSSIPLDSSILPLSPPPSHSMSTPLLNHPPSSPLSHHPSSSPLSHHPSSSPLATPSVPPATHSTIKLADTPPTNPHIQRLKNL